MKVIPINSPDRKLTNAECKKILNKNGNNYTDKEIEMIREFIYLLVDVIIENHKNQKHEEELHTLYPGEYRRAS